MKYLLKSVKKTVWTFSLLPFNFDVCCRGVVGFDLYDLAPYSRGSQWAPGTSRQFSDSGSKEGKSKSIPASSPTTSQSSTRRKKNSQPSKPGAGSRSSSNESRSSSGSSESGSQRLAPPLIACVCFVWVPFLPIFWKMF